MAGHEAGPKQQTIPAFSRVLPWASEDEVGADWLVAELLTRAKLILRAMAKDVKVPLP